MTENVERYLEIYYYLKIKKVIKSKLPNFVKINKLKKLYTEFNNDIFSNIRLSENQKEFIYSLIQNNIDFCTKLVNIKTNPLKNILKYMDSMYR